VGALTYSTLEHVAMQARPYPTHLLEGCETGLCLFAAAFLGHNDVVHFAEAGMEATCVDIDYERIAEMAQLYPRSWHFAIDDAWKYAEHAYAIGETWDAVSVDTFTGDAMVRSLESLELWCSLARKFVTVTIDDTVVHIVIPEGWTESHYPRSSDVDWLVLTRD
jgi:hypothetical protein